MKKRRLPLLLILLATFISSSIYSQMTVSGTVIDEQNEPLIGVNILVKGTGNGTATDVNGNYSLEVNKDDVMVFSYTGYTEQEISVGVETTINLTLEEGTLLDEVVVVAYGVQKKVTVTGAVSSLKGKALVKSPSVNLTTSLAGRLPGLVVIQPSGEPGNDDATISIRGTNTLGNSSPLIVIDGIPDRDGGIGRLNSQDIESVSVLKDASAAIYGARAANGAILVTTKRGAAGKTTVSYDFNLGWSQPTVIPEMSNAFEYANIMNELPIYQSIPVGEWSAASNSIKTSGSYDSPTPGIGSLNANFSPEAVQKHKDGSDPWGYADSDWFGATFKDWSAQKRHHLGISGGSEKVQYYASLGFTDQDAFYKNSATYYKQYSVRLNLNAEINEYVSANIGINGRREDRNYPTENANAIFRMLMRGRPTEPAVWPNGMPGPDIENGQQPVVITTNATGYVSSPSDVLQLNGGIDITNPWVDGLKLTLMASVDKNNNSNKIWQTPWELYFWDKVTLETDGTPHLEPAIRSNFTDPRLTQTSSTLLNTNITALLSYDRQFGSDHHFNALAGVTKERFEGDGFFAFRRNYVSAAIDQLFAGGADAQNTGGSGYNRTRLGYYGRFQYDFKEKYLAELIWRYDGSYIFPEGERFGFFPGVLLGWNISSEKWFNVDAFDYLKARVSYGQMGNDQVFFNGQLQEYAYLPTYSFGQFPINGSVANTLTETILANPNFTWEKANNFNFGIDASLFGKFDFILEYFNNKRDQILIQKTGSTPGSSGISSLLPPVNAGKVENQGFEFSLNYNGGSNTGSGLRYSVGVNGGYAKNEVIFMDEVPGAPDYQLQEGKPIGAYLVYESDGAFLDQAAIEANTIDYSELTSQLIPGDMRFKDTDGNGIINGDDQVRLDENVIPKFNYGITFNADYKNFDFSMLWQGASGASVPVQTESGDIGNYLKYSHDNRWSIDNPSSEHPRLASRGDTYYTGGNYGNNTYFLFDKDYIRLKTLELGYTIGSDGIIGKAGFSSLRIFVNGFNLVTFDKHKVFDPET
ncbi:MAG: TonB-linked SusC/RagA family outer membrane protein, partial [Saprospiraceae bacterium]